MILVLLLASATACNNENAKANQKIDQQTNATDTAKMVKTARIAEKIVAQTITANGTLAVYDQATVSVKVPGRLESINIDLGSVVKKGQLIAQIEQRDYKLRLEQAKAALMQGRVRLGLSPEGDDDRIDPKAAATVRQNQALLDEAAANRDRSATLLKQGLISQAAYDATEAAYKVAQSRYQDALDEVSNRQAVLVQRRSELALAEQQLADTAIYAPFDGIVQQRQAGLGEYLSAGAQLATIVKVDPLRLRLEVSERESKLVSVGDKVRVTVDGEQGLHQGEIKRISPAIAEQNRMLIVEADVQNKGGLRAGAFVRAEIEVDEGRPIITVPTNSVVTFAGIEKIVIVQDGKAVEKQVTTGIRNPDWTQIVSGAETGSEVIIDPGNIQQGQAVKVDAETR